MRCNLCGQNTICPCRGGGCKGCGQSNNQVTYTNELLKLGLKPEVIRENFDFIHKAQSSRVQAFDIRDNLENGKELSEEKLNAINNGTTLKGEPIKRVIKSDAEGCTPKDNPTQEHSFSSKTNPRVRCDYCCGIAKYVKKEPCPAFKLDNKE